MLSASRYAEEHGFKVMFNCTDLGRIRSMRGWCLIVTDEYLMRGVDYRLQETHMLDGKDGIDLLVACPFSNTRAYQQGLARVGRYNEPCSRYQLEDTQMTDEQSVLHLDARLSRCKG